MKIKMDFDSIDKPPPPPGWWPACIESATIGKSANKEITLARFKITFQNHGPLFLFFNLDIGSGVQLLRDLVLKFGYKIDPKSVQDSIAPLIGEECYALVELHEYHIGKYKGTIRPVIKQLRAALGEQGEVWEAFQRMNANDCS